jgi:hypothetical protein
MKNIRYYYECSCGEKYRAEEFKTYKRVWSVTRSQWEIVGILPSQVICPKCDYQLDLIGRMYNENV